MLVCAPTPSNYKQSLSSSCMKTLSLRQKLACAEWRGLQHVLACITCICTNGFRWPARMARACTIRPSWAT
jgi:hypothetical protein